MIGAALQHTPWSSEACVMNKTSRSVVHSNANLPYVSPEIHMGKMVHLASKPGSPPKNIIVELAPHY